MIKRIAIITTLVSAAFAITGGPNMPEYVQFEEVSANNLVDPNSGNFTYVIPLMEVPGPGGTYPLALSYHSGIRYNQEASWVGLGWSLNAGAINRVLRGVPDEYFNSMVATRNRLDKSGVSIGVNMGIGPMGLSMNWDANTGQFQGASPSIGLSTSMIPGMGALGSVASANITLSAGGISAGVGGTLPIGSISVGLYNSSNNSAGSNPMVSRGFNGSAEKGGGAGNGGSNLSFGASTFHTSGSSIGASAGVGDMSYAVNGFTVSIGYFSLGVSETDWRYSLDEAVIDYMNGFLFQDGVGTGFINRVPEAQTYLFPGSTVPSPPHQRFERTKIGTSLLPSADLYMVSANGLAGTFQPLIRPGANVPLIVDGGGKNNEGYKIETPPSIYDLTFRMGGDKGYNLLHDQAAVSGQLPYDEFDYTYGNATKMRQYGSYRIMPIFTKPAGSSSYKNILTGFIIRNADGMTYEYRQPVYTLMQADYAFTDPMEATESDRMGKVNGERYANAWLLTSIKGADYLSANPDKTFPSEGDLGHWVRFDYTTPTLVNWSAPDKGNAPPEDKASGYYTRSYGIREQTFLKAIETQTHKAVFETVDRVDVPISTNNPTNNPSGNSDRMTLDDGLLASRYDGGYGENGSESRYHVIPAGGFPIQITNPNDHAFQLDLHATAGFTMTFPGDWGKYILNYRAAHCDNKPCNDDANNVFEKFIGLHIKFTFLGEVDCPFSSCQSEEVAWNTRVVVGKNKFYSRYDEHIYGFSLILHCPDILVNAEGDTKVTCSVDMWTGTPEGARKTDILNMRVYTAFLNWPELEKLKALDYSNRPQALSAIKLFNKVSPDQVTKEIRFGYDYSLCNNLYPEHPGISAVESRYHDQGVYLSTADASNKGKLTLKKVSVYGNGGLAGGSAAKLPDYLFGYQSGAANPDYSGTYNQDIWGMYAPAATQTSRGVKQTNTAAAGSPPNGGEMAGVAWNLNKITLPTGGRIEIDYKRDEYYFAGLAKDAVTQKYLAFPDVFELEMPKTTATTPSYDWSRYYKLTINETVQVKDLNLSANNINGFNIPTLSVGPDGKDDYAITASGTSPTEPLNGEMALVAFVMERAPYNTPTFFTPAFTGVVNVGIVNRTDVSTQKRVRLTPLVQKDANNRFFYYANFRHSVTGGANYRFSYYLIPIRNTDRKFFGGDVAVKSIKSYNGMGGQPLTKKYEYFAAKVRDSQGNYLSGGDFPLTSGATWTMPEMLDKDKYQRYWFPGTNRSRNLNFDPWPYWCAMPDGKPNTCGTDPSGYVTPPEVPTKNILTKFLDEAFEQESLPGVQYYPGAGISYSRPRESTVNSQGAALGYTEFQFYNLANAFLNNGAAHNQAAPTRNFEINDWVSSGGVINANLTALSGKMMRKYEVSNSDAILQKNEYEYATDVTAYKCAGTTSQCPTPSETVPLGAVQQRTGWKIGPNSQYSSVRVPVAHLVKDISVIDGVRNEVQNLAFDSKSGVTLASSKTNSDNRGLASYAIPLHWGSAQALAGNRLNAVAEERTYAMPTGTSFDRTALSRIISSRISVWVTVPVRTLWGQQQQSNHLYKVQSHIWRAPLGTNGLALAQYVTPDQSFGSPWAPESPKVTLTSLYGYPLETRDGITGLVTATYTGHNTNLVTGVVANAKWKEATILTCDYAHPDNPMYFDAMTGWKKGLSGKVSLEASNSDLGMKVIKLENSGLIYSDHIALDPASPRKYQASFRANASLGTLTLTLQPNVGPAKSVMLQNTYFERGELEIDLKESQYAGATSLHVEIKTSAGGLGYVQEIRVHPSDALASSFFYDPISYKLVATLDENGEYKKFVYDARGRLISKQNYFGAETDSYNYSDMANPQ